MTNTIRRTSPRKSEKLRCMVRLCQTRRNSWQSRSSSCSLQTSDRTNTSNPRETTLATIHLSLDQLRLVRGDREQGLRPNTTSLQRGHQPHPPQFFHICKTLAHGGTVRNLQHEPDSCTERPWGGSWSMS